MDLTEPDEEPGPEQDPAFVALSAAQQATLLPTVRLLYSTDPEQAFWQFSSR